MLIAAGGVPRVSEAACTPDPPADDDVVTCTGSDSTGYDGSGATGLTITTSGVTVLDDSDPVLDAAILIADDNDVTLGADATVTITEAAGAGVRGGDRNTLTQEGSLVVESTATGGLGLDVGDDNDVTNAAGGLITVDADDGVGIRGLDDNFVENLGRIVVNGADGRAIWIGANTGLPLPNGAVTTGEIVLEGAGSIGILSGQNSGVVTGGVLEVNGDGARGLSAGDKTPDGRANITNTGTLTVAGDDAFGLKVGDGWFGSLEDDDGDPLTPDVFVPDAPGVRNDQLGSIVVSGDRSFGIFTGDETNLAGDHDSFVLNIGAIDVTGVDSVGISVGGNDQFDPFDYGGDDVRPLRNSLENAGELTGGPDSGPLIEIRDFVPGRENRILNFFEGTITADTTNRGTPGRGLAVLGSAGQELLYNFGTIEGDVDLGDGDDRYVQAANGRFEGQLDGGDGQDELILGVQVGALQTFDLSQVDGFERLRIDGNDLAGGAVGWALANGNAFLGVTEVIDGGRLEVPAPLTLGGDLEVAPTGTVAVTLDGPTVPLTVLGNARLDGTLEVSRGANLQPSATPYRVLDVAGTITGQFATIDLPASSGRASWLAEYDADGVLVTFADFGLPAVAQGRNRRAIALHLDAIEQTGGASGDLEAVLDGLLDATGSLNGFFDALSPEAYDAQTTLLVDGGRRVTRLLFERPRDCEPGERDPWRSATDPLPCHARGWEPWLAMTGGFRRREAFAGHPRYDAQLGGVVMGVDSPSVAGLDATFALAAQRGRVDVARAGESTLTLLDLQAQLAWTHEALRLQGAVGWGHGFHDAKRLIRFDEGTAVANVRGVETFDSDRVSLAAEAGYQLTLPYVTLEPLVGTDWVWLFQDGIRESEAGGLGLRVESRDDTVGSVHAGVRLGTTYHHRAYLIDALEWMDGVWRPTVDLRWREFVEGYDRELSARLSGSPDTVAGFTIEGKEDRGGFEVGAGLAFVPENADRLQVELRYRAYVASHTLDQDLVARVALGF